MKFSTVFLAVCAVAAAATANAADIKPCDGVDGSLTCCDKVDGMEAKIAKCKAVKMADCEKEADCIPCVDHAVSVCVPKVTKACSQRQDENWIINYGGVGAQCTASYGKVLDYSCGNVAGLCCEDQKAMEQQAYDDFQADYKECFAIIKDSEDIKKQCTDKPKCQVCEGGLAALGGQFCGPKIRKANKACSEGLENFNGIVQYEQDKCSVITTPHSPAPCDGITGGMLCCDTLPTWDQHTTDCFMIIGDDDALDPATLTKRCNANKAGCQVCGAGANMHCGPKPIKECQERSDNQIYTYKPDKCFPTNVMGDLIGKCEGIPKDLCCDHQMKFSQNNAKCHKVTKPNQKASAEENAATMKAAERDCTVDGGDCVFCMVGDEGRCGPRVSGAACQERVGNMVVTFKGSKCSAQKFRTPGGACDIGSTTMKCCDDLGPKFDNAAKKCLDLMKADNTAEKNENDCNASDSCAWCGRNADQPFCGPLQKDEPCASRHNGVVVRFGAKTCSVKKLAPHVGVCSGVAPGTQCCERDVLFFRQQFSDCMKLYDVGSFKDGNSGADAEKACNESKVGNGCAMCNNGGAKFCGPKLAAKGGEVQTCEERTDSDTITVYSSAGVCSARQVAHGNFACQGVRGLCCDDPAGMEHKKAWEDAYSECYRPITTDLDKDGKSTFAQQKKDCIANEKCAFCDGLVNEDGLAFCGPKMQKNSWKQCSERISDRAIATYGETCSTTHLAPTPGTCDSLSAPCCSTIMKYGDQAAKCEAAAPVDVGGDKVDIEKMVKACNDTEGCQICGEGVLGFPRCGIIPPTKCQTREGADITTYWPNSADGGHKCSIQRSDLDVGPCEGIPKAECCDYDAEYDALMVQCFDYAPITGESKADKAADEAALEKMRKTCINNKAGCQVCNRGDIEFCGPKMVKKSCMERNGEFVTKFAADTCDSHIFRVPRGPCDGVHGKAKCCDDQPHFDEMLAFCFEAVADVTDDPAAFIEKCESSGSCYVCGGGHGIPAFCSPKLKFKCTERVHGGAYCADTDPFCTERGHLHDASDAMIHYEFGSCRVQRVESSGGPCDGVHGDCCDAQPDFGAAFKSCFAETDWDTTEAQKVQMMKDCEDNKTPGGCAWCNNGVAEFCGPKRATPCSERQRGIAADTITTYTDGTCKAHIVRQQSECSSIAQGQCCNDPDDMGDDYQAVQTEINFCFQLVHDMFSDPKDEEKNRKLCEEGDGKGRCSFCGANAGGGTDGAGDHPQINFCGPILPVGTGKKKTCSMIANDVKVTFGSKCQTSHIHADVSCNGVSGACCDRDKDPAFDAKMQMCFKIANDFGAGGMDVAAAKAKCEANTECQFCSGGAALFCGPRMTRTCSERNGDLITTYGADKCVTTPVEHEYGPCEGIAQADCCDSNVKFDVGMDECFDIFAPTEGGDQGRVDDGSLQKTIDLCNSKKTCQWCTGGDPQSWDRNGHCGPKGTYTCKERNGNYVTEYTPGSCASTLWREPGGPCDIAHKTGAKCCDDDPTFAPAFKTCFNLYSVDDADASTDDCDANKDCAMCGVGAQKFCAPIRDAKHTCSERTPLGKTNDAIITYGNKCSVELLQATFGPCDGLDPAGGACCKKQPLFQEHFSSCFDIVDTSDLADANESEDAVTKRCDANTASCSMCDNGHIKYCGPKVTKACQMRDADASVTTYGPDQCSMAAPAIPNEPCEPCESCKPVVTHTIEYKDKEKKETNWGLVAAAVSGWVVAVVMFAHAYKTRKESMDLGGRRPTALELKSELDYQRFSVAQGY